MSNARILTGPRFNFLGRALSITLSPDAADPLFPSTNLWIDHPAVVCKFNAASANEQILVDLQHVLNGNMEGGFTAGVANSWTKTGAGACTSEGTNIHGGTAAQKIDATAGETYISQYITAKPGEQWKVTAWTMTGIAGKGSGTLFVQNELTGNFFNGASWVATTSTGAVTSSTTTYAQLSTTLTVETSPILLWNGTVRLKIICDALFVAGGSATYFDDVEAYPAVDFAGIFGHNMDPLIVPQFASGATTSAWTTQATPSLLPLTFYSVLGAPVFARYWLALFSGTQVAGGTPGTVTPIWLGEYVLGQTTVLLRTQDYGPKTKHHEFQGRTMTQAGDQYVYVLGGGPQRTLTLAFTETSTSEYQQVRDIVFRHSRGGHSSIVVIPWDADPDVCIYGRINPDMDESRDLLNYWKVGLTVVEAALPIVI